MVFGPQRASQGYGGGNGIGQVLGLNDLLKQVYKPPGQKETDDMFQEFLDALSSVEKKVDPMYRDSKLSVKEAKEYMDKNTSLPEKTLKSVDPVVPNKDDIKVHELNFAGIDVLGIYVTYDNRYVYVKAPENVNVVKEIPLGYMLDEAVYYNGMLSLRYRKGVVMGMKIILGKK